jgi:hypothetical protein
MHCAARLKGCCLFLYLLFYIDIYEYNYNKPELAYSFTGKTEKVRSVMETCKCHYNRVFTTIKCYWFIPDEQERNHITILDIWNYTLNRSRLPQPARSDGQRQSNFCYYWMSKPNWEMVVKSSTSTWIVRSLFDVVFSLHWDGFLCENVSALKNPAHLTIRVRMTLTTM